MSCSVLKEVLSVVYSRLHLAASASPPIPVAVLIIIWRYVGNLVPVSVLIECFVVECLCCQEDGDYKLVRHGSGKGHIIHHKRVGVLNTQNREAWYEEIIKMAESAKPINEE